jgi:hypothetical protein
VLSRVVNKTEVRSARSVKSAIRCAVRARWAFCRQADEQYTASDRAVKPVPHTAHVATLISVTLQLTRLHFRTIAVELPALLQTGNLDRRRPSVLASPGLLLQFVDKL